MATVKIIGENLENGTSSFIKKTEVSAPFSTIQNRAKVSNSLQAIVGVERIHVNSLNKLLKESGPNGETAYEPDNGDTRVRFYGNVSSNFSSDGTRAELLNSSEAKGFEVTFYGTGLNMLHFSNGGDNRDATVSIDGGANAPYVFDEIGRSSVLQQRNYKMNVVSNLVSDLPLGWHTVKFEHTQATTTLIIFGFEILNEASQITVKGGTAYSSGKELTIADALLDYRLGFDNVADLDVGALGGRAVIYADVDGTVKKRLTKVDAAPAYLASADHTNEARYRVINFREFGRDRGDDFSTLSTSSSDRAFTLDDGTTTLIGDNASVGAGWRNPENLALGASGFLTLTFVGTGLDVRIATDSGARQATVEVNGDSKGTISKAAGEYEDVRTICSGLPYGTHTVKFLSSTLGYQDFIIYQPKKAELPENVVEIAEYSVMADFVANTVQNQDTISTGTVRKDSTREFLYEGSWATSFSPIQVVGGTALYTSGAGNKVKVTFWGTGFDMRHLGEANGSSNISARLNGIDLTTANYATAVSSTYGSGAGFDLGTGILDQDMTVGNLEGCGWIIQDLPLDLYTLELEVNDGDYLRVDSFDIITPIHSPHTTFGSRSIKDLRNFDSNKDVNKEIKNSKVEIVWDGTNTLVKKSKGISQIYRTGTGIFLFVMEEPFVDGDWVLYGTLNGSGMVFHFDNINSKGATMQVATLNYQGTYVNYSKSSAIFEGKLQKDELEE